MSVSTPQPTSPSTSQMQLANRHKTLAFATIDGAVQTKQSTTQSPSKLGKFTRALFRGTHRTPTTLPPPQPPPLSQSAPSSQSASLSRPLPLGITCGNCKQVGLHFSADCPLRCEYCGKLGHEAVDCAPTCVSCMGRGVIRKTGYENDHEHTNPEIRLLRASINGVGEASASILEDYQKRYEAEVGHEIEAFEDGDGGPVNPTLVERTTLLRNLEEGIYMTKHLVTKSMATLDRLAKLDDESGTAQRL